MVDVLLPFVSAMINASLREGQLPSSHRHAIVTPLLKSYRLDADEPKNYRPVSNLSFISKLTEREPCDASLAVGLRHHLSKCCRTYLLSSTNSEWHCLLCI